MYLLVYQIITLPGTSVTWVRESESVYFSPYSLLSSCVKIPPLTHLNFLLVFCFHSCKHTHTHSLFSAWQPEWALLSVNPLMASKLEWNLNPLACISNSSRSGPCFRLILLLFFNRPSYSGFAFLLLTCTKLTPTLELLHSQLPLSGIVFPDHHAAGSFLWFRSQVGCCPLGEPFLNPRPDSLSRSSPFGHPA